MSYGAWLGMLGMGIVGVAVAGIAVLAAFFVAYGGAGTLAVYVVFAGLTVVPAILLWLPGNRYLRAGAVGLAAAFLSASVLVLWSPWATLSEGEVERAKSEALASGNPAFYLGDEVNGYPLNDYYLGPDQANFFYGECHDDPSTAGDPDPPPCIWDVEVYTWWTAVTIGGDAIAGCVRQAPVAGVPTAHLHDQVLGSNEVVIFTGKSQVTIAVEAESSVEEQLEIARKVRRVGDAEPATSLASPRPNILAYFKYHCAPGP
jgi:hypothetical protein